MKVGSSGEEGFGGEEGGDGRGQKKRDSTSSSGFICFLVLFCCVFVLYV